LKRPLNVFPSAALRFPLGIFHLKKTNRKNSLFLYLIAALRLPHGSLPAYPEDKNGSFCMSAGLCRSSRTFEIAQSAQVQLQVIRNTSTYFILPVIRVVVKMKIW